MKFDSYVRSVEVSKVSKDSIIASPELTNHQRESWFVGVRSPAAPAAHGGTLRLIVPP